MNKKKLSLLIVAAIAVFAIVGVVSAQREQPGRPGAGGQEPILRQLMQIISGELGIAPGDILVQLQDQTLEEVITANGGSVDEISAEITESITERVNAAVEQGTLAQERADEILAELAAQVQSAMNGEFAGLRPGILRDLRQPGFDGDRRPGMRFPRQHWGWNDTRPLFNAAVEATGLTAQEIVQAIRSGSTLGGVISENGGDPSAVIRDALASVQTQLDEAVANGRITQEQEDAILAGLQAFYEAVMNGAWQDAAPEAVDAAV